MTKIFRSSGARVDEDDSKKTSISLLGRLRAEVADPDDWSEFVRRYRPLLLGWCRRWGLQDSDAEDVTQDVLVKLAAKLRTFRYDPSQSFRAYARTLAYYAWRDSLESRGRPGARGSGDSDVIDQLLGVAARDDLQERIADAFDRELLEIAMARVRLRVESRTWEAFRLTAIEGLSAADAAGRAGMTVAASFKAKSKVQIMIREEIRCVEEDQARP